MLGNSNNNINCAVLTSYFPKNLVNYKYFMFICYRII